MKYFIVVVCTIDIGSFLKKLCEFLFAVEFCLAHEINENICSRKSCDGTVIYYCSKFVLYMLLQKCKF